MTTAIIIIGLIVLVIITYKLATKESVCPQDQQNHQPEYDETLGVLRCSKCGHTFQMGDDFP